MEQKEILNRWKQYFESLLKTEIETIEIKGQDEEPEEETERMGQDLMNQH